VDLDDMRAALEKLQKTYEAARLDVIALQMEILKEEQRANAEAMLDSLTPDERGVLIKAAAVRMDAGRARG
jgi:flagellar motility protein MotE (MotC chaperone)